MSLREVGPGLLFGLLIVSILGGVPAGPSQVVSSQGPATTKPTPAEELTAFLGEPTVRLLPTVDRAEVFRISSELSKSEDPSHAIGGYRILAKGTDPGTDFARDLARVLLDPSTYRFDRDKGCVFKPGVAYRLRSGTGTGTGTLEVVLCFGCDGLKVVARDGDRKVIREAFEDFDPARAELVRLAKAAFPDDPEIRELTAEP